MHSILTELARWAAQDHFMVAVGGPLAVWSLVLSVEAYRGSYTKELLGFWLLGAAVTFATGRWEEGPDYVSLHLVCVFSLICFFLVYAKRAVPPLLAGALVFYNLLMNDVAHATVRSWSGGLDHQMFLTGVGGAAHMDGLFVFPLMTTAVLFYANWRLGRTPKLALWY